jgi:hypothetical protein
MPISSDFNFDDILSLDKAKLTNRVRVNFLGSQELILRYNNVGSAMREDAVEYLEATAGYGIASAMTSPTFGFKTYEGDWFCIDIEYNEDKQFIQQRFKIDAQIGDLGDPDVTPVSSQVGDDVRVSDGMTLERSYYWRIVNPERVGLPTATTGVIWTKTSNDNGDGTYDVIISKEVEINLTAGSSVSSDLYTEVSETNTNDVETSFSSDSYGDSSVADAVFREVKRIDNVPLENGKFRSTVTTRTSIADKQSFAYPSDYSAVGAQLVVARNQPFSELAVDLAVVNPSPWVYVTSVSLSPNDDGTYNYTISAHI